MYASIPNTGDKRTIVRYLFIVPSFYWEAELHDFCTVPEIIIQALETKDEHVWLKNGLAPYSAQ